jgi:hypothetical protein
MSYAPREPSREVRHCERLGRAGADRLHTTMNLRSHLCWLFGHDLAPISDYWTLDQWCAELAATGRAIFSRCRHCGRLR